MARPPSAAVTAAGAGTLSLPVAVLAEGMLNAMFWSKIKWATAIVLVVAVAMMGVSFGAGRAAAQGPQGAGAGSASSSSSGGTHSLNPIKWVKKDPKSASDQLDAKDEQDKKLTANLQAQGVLPANTDAKSAC